MKLTILFLLLTQITFAQNKDTLSVDTTNVKVIKIGNNSVNVADIFSPVLITGIADTVKVSPLMYMKGDDVKVASSGYYVYYKQVFVRRGQVVGELTNWEQISALDENKKPVRMVPPTKYIK